MSWESGSIAVAVGACLGGSALMYVTLQPAHLNSLLNGRTPAPQAAVEPCGAGMALAGVLAEPGVL